MRAAALLLLAAAGCRSDGRAPAADLFLAPDGTPVALDDLPADRIASTLQSATEWIVLLGESGRMVARTDYDRQPELAHLPSIGGGLETSPEVLAALSPDLVIGWRIRASVDLARVLAPLGIPVITGEATDTTGIFQQLAMVGAVVGREAAADSAATALRGRIDSIRTASRCDEAGTATAMVVISTDPPMTVGRTSWMSQLLGAACLTNAFGSLENAWPAISLEALVAADPDWLITSEGRGDPDRFTSLPGWRDLTAVREGRIIRLPDDLFTRSGPTVGDWIVLVAEARMARR